MYITLLVLYRMPYFREFTSFSKTHPTEPLSISVCSEAELIGVGSDVSSSRFISLHTQIPKYPAFPPPVLLIHTYKKTMNEFHPILKQCIIAKARMMQQQQTTMLFVTLHKKYSKLVRHPYIF